MPLFFFTDFFFFFFLNHHIKQEGIYKIYYKTLQNLFNFIVPRKVSLLLICDYTWWMVQSLFSAPVLSLDNKKS